MKQLITIGALVLLSLLVVWGCTENVGDPVGGDDPGDGTNPPVVTQNTCLGCHSSESNLKTALGSSGGASMAPAAASGDG